MSKFFSFLLDLVFPIHCLNCNREGVWLCGSCWTNLRLKLAKKIEEFSSNSTNYNLKFFDQFLVVATYQQSLLSEILHALKYKNIRSLGKYLSQLAIDYLHNLDESDLNFDVVVPVPLTKKRKLIRGFNQSEIIAAAICQEFNLKLSASELIRKVNTHPQVGLNAQQRLKNVQGIFTVNNSIVFKNKKILLVDDVLTTGATMKECAKMLKKSGAKEIWGIVMFKG